MVKYLSELWIDEIDKPEVMQDIIEGLEGIYKSRRGDRPLLSPVPLNGADKDWLKARFIAYNEVGVTNDDVIQILIEKEDGKKKKKYAPTDGAPFPFTLSRSVIEHNLNVEGRKKTEEDIETITTEIEQAENKKIQDFVKALRKHKHLPPKIDQAEITDEKSKKDEKEKRLLEETLEKLKKYEEERRDIELDIKPIEESMKPIRDEIEKIRKEIAEKSTICDDLKTQRKREHSHFDAIEGQIRLCNDEGERQVLVKNRDEINRTISALGGRIEQANSEIEKLNNHLLGLQDVMEQNESEIKLLNNKAKNDLKNLSYHIHFLIKNNNIDPAKFFEKMTSISSHILTPIVEEVEKARMIDRLDKLRDWCRQIYIHVSDVPEWNDFLGKIETLDSNNLREGVSKIEANIEKVLKERFDGNLGDLSQEEYRKKVAGNNLKRAQALAQIQELDNYLKYLGVNASQQPDVDSYDYIKVNKVLESRKEEFKNELDKYKLNVDEFKIFKIDNELFDKNKFIKFAYLKYIEREMSKLRDLFPTLLPQLGKKDRVACGKAYNALGKILDEYNRKPVSEFDFGPTDPTELLNALKRGAIDPVVDPVNIHKDNAERREKLVSRIITSISVTGSKLGGGKDWKSNPWSPKVLYSIRKKMASSEKVSFEDHHNLRSELKDLLTKARKVKLGSKELENVEKEYEKLVESFKDINYKPKKPPRPIKSS